MSNEKTVAIMQPYFLPYIGYWQLLDAVDVFVIYVDIQYTKKSWINRNRFLNNNKDEYFTIPIKKDSDYLDIDKRVIADSFDKDKQKLLRKFESAYRKSPYFQDGMELLNECFGDEQKNLFEFIYHSIRKIIEKLNIDTKIIVSSTLKTNDRKGADRVIATCKLLGASEYINPIGGMTLYDKDVFSKANIKLHFQNVNEVQYKQFDNKFIPSLSIIDTIMFNGFNGTRGFLQSMELV